MVLLHLDPQASNWSQNEYQSEAEGEKIDCLEFWNVKVSVLA